MSLEGTVPTSEAPAKILSLAVGRNRVNGANEHGVLCQSLGFAFQQTTSRLGTLELSLHHTQRLARGKDGLSILKYRA